MGWVGARSARAISYKPKTNNNDYKAREAEFMGSVLTQITIRGKDKDK